MFSVITPWYDVSIHGLCLFTAEEQKSAIVCQWGVCFSVCLFFFPPPALLFIPGNIFTMFIKMRW